MMKAAIFALIFNLFIGIRVQALELSDKNVINPECHDRSNNCEYYRKDNRCRSGGSAATRMASRLCKRTCGFCDSGKPVCIDTDKNCTLYIKNLGENDTCPENCCASCGGPSSAYVGEEVSPQCKKGSLNYICKRKRLACQGVCKNFNVSSTHYDKRPYCNQISVEKACTDKIHKNICKGRCNYPAGLPGPDGVKKTCFDLQGIMYCNRRKDQCDSDPVVRGYCRKTCNACKSVCN